MNKELPLISVVVPIYNVEKFLETCVDSIIKQTYKNLEIILVDDGSRDNCPKICEQYAATEPRVRVIHQKNKGLSGARNIGIENAKGEFILFVDSDDLISNQMIEQLLTTILEMQADIASCEFENFYEDQDVKNLSVLVDNGCLTETSRITYSKESILTELVNKGGVWLVTACGKLYRRQLWDNIRFPDGKIHEDEYVVHKILAECDKYVYVEEKMYFYRQRRESIMNTRKSVADDDEFGAYQDRILFYTQNYPEIPIDKLVFKLWFLLKRMGKEMREKDQEKSRKYLVWEKNVYYENKNKLKWTTKMKILICKININWYERIRGRN